MRFSRAVFFFFFIAAAAAGIYTLSLHDALPISRRDRSLRDAADGRPRLGSAEALASLEDRKSTRLNSSHRCISYAVFCLKKKNKHARASPPPPKPPRDRREQGRSVSRRRDRSPA